MDKAIEEQIINTIKDVMDVDVTKIDKDKKLNTIPEWDSFNNLMLISRFQEDFKIEFTAIEIENTTNIREIFKLIEKKLS